MGRATSTRTRNLLKVDVAMDCRCNGIGTTVSIPMNLRHRADRQHQTA